MEALNFIDCVKTYSKLYPTIYAAKQIGEEVSEDWRLLYSHEGQDQIQRSRREMRVEFLGKTES